MRSGDLFIDLHAPAWASGDSHVPIVNLRDSRGQSILPGHIVNVNLHDADVGQDGAQGGTGEGCQVAVVVVGRHIELIDFRQIANFLRLTEAVPGYVNHEDIGGVALEIWDVVVHVVQIFARTDLRGGGLLDLQESVR